MIYIVKYSVNITQTFNRVVPPHDKPSSRVLVLKIHTYVVTVSQNRTGTVTDSCLMVN